MPIVIAVAATTFKVERFDTVNLAVAVLAIVSVCVVAAPFHAIYRNTNAFGMNRNFLNGAAQEITRRWHATTDAPFTTITGDDNPHSRPRSTVRIIRNIDIHFASRSG